MYIIKNALRCISRSKGRSILIGIIALVIAVSACIGLSIRQASENAKTSALKGMSVTATISYDRAGAMGDVFSGFSGGRGGFSGGFDRGQFSGKMGNSSSLTLEEYRKYAGADSVKDFYYTLTAYFNGSDDFLPVSDEETENDEEGGTIEGELDSDTEKKPGGFPGGTDGMGGMMFGGFSSGDFTVIGYSSDTSMTDFVNGNAAILEGGSMFEEGTTDYVCVISEELALYNNLSVGDTVVISNPSSEDETYTLTVSGFYSASQTNDFSMSMFGASQDPANKIYMSANALSAILDASEEVSETVTDEATGRKTETKITGTLSATYTFANTDDYYAFEEEVRTLGLDESYTVSSSDISAFENSLTPLNTLSTMAKGFLIVILIIGSIILVVLNIFSVRERKYEVGVLTAMGMKKWKVAAQFTCEILAITMLAVVIGAGIGAVSSVPITNALLENQISNQNSQKEQVDNSFGRPGNMPNMPGGMKFGGSMPSDLPDNADFDGNNPFENLFSGASDYITEVDSAMNLKVVGQMILVGLLLTLAASAASVLFIMRYDPLKILANRD